jgi:hypothetical protein
MPVYSLIEDLRVLAVRAEPPAVFFDAAATDVTFDALVVDPHGGPIDVSWSFCPVESNKACRDIAEGPGSSRRAIARAEKPSGGMPR